MKIRTNFVSNSSSSSFLVVVNDSKVLEKFSQFNGYDCLKKDMGNSTPKKVHDFLKRLLFEGLADEAYDYYCACIDENNGGRYENSLANLMEFVGGDAEEKYEALVMDIMNKVKKAAEANEGKKRSWWFTDMVNIVHGHDDALEEIASLISKQFDQSKVSVVGYEDHSDEGCYMEHYFMPFVMRVPEKGLKVFRLDEH